MSGYESQQAFTDIFKAMYKTSPAEFRETENFYPLQLEIYLKEELVKMDLTKDNIKFATPEDADDWMELVSLTIDGYPCLDKEDYAANLHRYIADKKALILRDDDMAIGVMGFSPDTGSIDFLAVHPQYRHLGITKLFLDKLADELLYGKEITLTTYRAGDKADTGWREEYRRLGFAERELLVEYGYPTQRFVLPPKNKEEIPQGIPLCEKEKETRNDRNTENPLAESFNALSLIRFAFPSMVMMLFMGLYTIVDTIFVARFVDTNALSSINIVCPVINLIVGLGTMLATGGSAVRCEENGEWKHRGSPKQFYVDCRGRGGYRSADYSGRASLFG